MKSIKLSPSINLGLFSGVLATIIGLITFIHRRSEFLAKVSDAIIRSIYRRYRGYHYKRLPHLIRILFIEKVGRKIK